MDRIEGRNGVSPWALAPKGSEILKTGYGGKRRVPADVSHEFGSCDRLNGTCPEHVRSTLFYGGICVYGSMNRWLEPPRPNPAKDYENIHDFFLSLSRVCSFRFAVHALCVLHRTCIEDPGPAEGEPIPYARNTKHLLSWKITLRTSSIVRMRSGISLRWKNDAAGSLLLPGKRSFTTGHPWVQLSLEIPISIALFDRRIDWKMPPRDPVATLATWPAAFNVEINYPEKNFNFALQNLKTSNIWLFIKKVRSLSTPASEHVRKKKTALTVDERTRLSDEPLIC